jgi:nucleoid-associated protein YgaU
MQRSLLAAACALALALPLLAQTDPGAREDAEADRKKLLRAADQIDVLQASLDAANGQLATLKAASDQQRNDLDAAKTEIATLKADNAALHQSLEKLDEARIAERKALLDEVAKIVADSGKHAPKEAAEPPPESKTETPAPSPDKTAAGGDQKGFDYVVVKGDTLHGIASAYAANGVHVTVADIRKANGMGPKDVIKTGQKLFIPKK